MSGANPSLVYACEQWEIDLGRRELRSRGAPVPLGGRAFEIVTVLVESASELVTKDQLMARVWPGAIVGEGTLHVHISAVRKALGPDRSLLKTASGRGYRLLGSWRPRQREATAAPVAAPPTRAIGTLPTNNFPPDITHLIGRSASVRFVRDLVSAYRVVTLTGPGGIGKTSLAIKAVGFLLPDFEDGGWIVELASLSDPDLVPSTVAGVLGLKLGDDKISAENVARAVGTKHLLLVLDNCEHLIEAVAKLAETLVRLCPRITLLATSQETLRIDGETVYRVPPLDVPAAEHETPEHMMRHSAVELFIARTKAMDTGFSPRAEDLASIAAICRRLDGIPLAIEFAAARAASLGIQQVAIGLGDRFALLTAGRRTALPRQRTLLAALDWSHDLLPDSERRLLRRLAIFPAGFIVDAAAAVMKDDGLDVAAVRDGIANLVAKSLVALDKADTGARWHLLETVRAYGLEKLKASGELDSAARRHAAYYRDLFEQSAREIEGPPTPELLADYGSRNDNVRAALDWAFSPNGDPAIALALTVASVPLCYQLSLVEECRARIERAFAHVSSGPSKDARLEMKLCIALGTSLFDTTGPVRDTSEIWTRALDLAAGLGDTEYQLRALWGLWASRLNAGDHRTTLTLARRFCSLAAHKAEPADLLVGDRMMAVSLHHLGHQPDARRHVEVMLARPSASVDRWRAIRFVLDQHVAARALLAQILWLQGLPDQAMEVGQRSVEEARTIGHAVTLCHALAQGACSVALLSGDLAATERFVALLLEHSATQALPIWQARGRCFEAALLISRGDLDRGLPQLHEALEGLGEARFAAMFGGMLAEGLGQAGQVGPALRTVETAIAHSERDEELWCLPELLRIKAELLVAANQSDAPAAAERLFRTALDTARDQGALSWQLRTAISLARQQRGRAGAEKARDIVAELCRQFSEGWGTRDLQAAKQLLERSRT